MDNVLKQQIDSWTEADEHQKVIDALERLSPAERDFETIGLLARAYNNIDEYEKAFDLLHSTRKEGEQNPRWNFRIGYALYFLGRYKESLSHFKKADELEPKDEDTLDFIRNCLIEYPFRKRVEDFWQWFTTHEAELSCIVEKRSEHDADSIVELVSQGTGLLAENVLFNLGGNHEFTFSVEGNNHLFYLYPYLISRMPDQWKEKWHFFPFNQGTDATFSFCMYETNVDMTDVHIAVTYREEQNDFAVTFYEKNLSSLPEAQCYNAFYIMMEIMLGEGLSYQYITHVERTDHLTEGMMTLPELRKHITETVEAHDKTVFDNPQQTHTCYNFEPQESEELRYDVVVGSTCFMALIAQYYQDSTELFDQINQFGAQASFLAFPFDNNRDEASKEILQFRNELEDRLENELLEPEGLGLLLGGAIGLGSCYIDLLLFDAPAFRDKIVPFLQNYPQYQFYLSDFRQHSSLVRLSELEV